MLTGIEWAAAHASGCAYVGSFACDTRFFPNDLVARLVRAVEEDGADLAYAASNGRSHPVIGLWPVRLMEDLRCAMMEENIRKVDVWTARHKLVTVDIPRDGHAGRPARSLLQRKHPRGSGTRGVFRCGVSLDKGPRACRVGALTCVNAAVLESMHLNTLNYFENRRSQNGPRCVLASPKEGRWP